LASAVGDIPQLIKDGVTGYLVRAGDIDALEKRMKEMMINPYKCKEMAEKAYQVVLERFSAERMVRDTEKLYKSIVF